MDKVHWLFFATLVIVGGVIFHLFSRLAKGEIDMIYAGVIAAIAGLAGSAAAFFLLADPHVIAAASTKGIIYAALAGLGTALASIAAFMMYKAGAPMSISSPITRAGATVFAVIFGMVLFSESLSFLNIVGVVLSIVSIVLMCL